MTDQKDSPDSQADEEVTRCTHCGAVIDTSDWYPTISGDDASYTIYEFCDEDCRDAWRNS